MQKLRIFLITLMIIASPLADAGKQSYSLNEMASRIQNQGAQILSAEVVKGKNGKVYRFKVKKKGRVRVLLMRPDGTRINHK